MKAFLIAGEPSGDRLGAALIAGLRELDPALEVRGIGGEGMAAQGLESLFPMSELSLMGIWEILPKYRALKRRIAQTAQAVIKAAPDVLITIDSPDFGLRVARMVRAAAPGIRTVHYVAPSVWAWRPGRARKMAQVIDHVLAILPFEPPLMQAAGMSCDFVGHPVVSEPLASAAEAGAFRAAHGIAADAPLVLCLPGSRRGEVARLGPRFDEALMRRALGLDTQAAPRTPWPRPELGSRGQSSPSQRAREVPVVMVGGRGGPPGRVPPTAIGAELQREREQRAAADRVVELHAGAFCGAAFPARITWPGRRTSSSRRGRRRTWP